MRLFENNLDILGNPVLPGPSSRVDNQNPEITLTPRKRNPYNRAPGSSSNWRIQQQRLIPKFWGPSVTAEGFPCQQKQRSPTGMKNHLQRKHFTLNKQFKQCKVEFRKQKVIVIWITLSSTKNCYFEIWSKSKLLSVNVWYQQIFWDLTQWGITFLLKY